MCKNVDKRAAVMFIYRFFDRRSRHTTFLIEENLVAILRF